MRLCFKFIVTTRTVRSYQKIVMRVYLFWFVVPYFYGFFCCCILRVFCLPTFVFDYISPNCFAFLYGRLTMIIVLFFIFWGYLFRWIYIYASFILHLECCSLTYLVAAFWPNMRIC